MWGRGLTCAVGQIRRGEMGMEESRHIPLKTYSFEDEELVQRVGKKPPT